MRMVCPNCSVARDISVSLYAQIPCPSCYRRGVNCQLVEAPRMPRMPAGSGPVATERVPASLR